MYHYVMRLTLFYVFCDGTLKGLLGLNSPLLLPAFVVDFCLVEAVDGWEVVFWVADGDHGHWYDVVWQVQEVGQGVGAFAKDAHPHATEVKLYGF